MGEKPMRWVDLMGFAPEFQPMPCCDAESQLATLRASIHTIAANLRQVAPGEVTPIAIADELEAVANG